MTLFCSSRSIFVIIIIIIIIITIIIITIIITTIVTIPSKSYLCYRTGNFRFLFFIFCSCVNIMFWSRPNHFLHFLNIMARVIFPCTFFWWMTRLFYRLTSMLCDGILAFKKIQFLLKCYKFPCYHLGFRVGVSRDPGPSPLLIAHRNVIPIFPVDNIE